ncbi:hypothetical protein [Rathayibacter sp. Leaf248]|uniref:hypothetical protein n=1 Tax=Rathayibacter sp. Leaf248 TaxID=2876555 RepID=UPI001E51A120|nr:hypothetical protein [Rathayibacter sp. Leaf248]
MSISRFSKQNTDAKRSGFAKLNIAHRVKVALATTFIAATVVVGTATPAQATGMRTISGNIICSTFPMVNIGTTATAKGDVDFQLMQFNNTGTQSYVDLGYSASYASWGWKFWNNRAGNFYALGLGSIGAVTAANRYCQGL